MKAKRKSKCLHCSEFYVPDYRNRGRQRHCSKPECRKASKALSQRRWNARPENENYFRGTDNSRRVKEWRSRNPGYWRNKSAAPAEPLQDPCSVQVQQARPVTLKEASCALQDLWFAQPALLVGLISTMTGYSLQEDIASCARSLFARGHDILGTLPGASANITSSP